MSFVTLVWDAAGCHPLWRCQRFSLSPSHLAGMCDRCLDRCNTCVTVVNLCDRRNTCVTTSCLLLLVQIRILEESGQLPLAYVAAASHGFEEEAARLREVRPAAVGWQTQPSAVGHMICLRIDKQTWCGYPPYHKKASPCTQTDLPPVRCGTSLGHTSCSRIDRDGAHAFGSWVVAAGFWLRSPKRQPALQGPTPAHVLSAIWPHTPQDDEAPRGGGRGSPAGEGGLRGGGRGVPAGEGGRGVSAGCRLHPTLVHRAAACVSQTPA